MYLVSLINSMLAQCYAAPSTGINSLMVVYPSALQPYIFVTCSQCSEVAQSSRANPIYLPGNGCRQVLVFRTVYPSALQPCTFVTRSQCSEVAQSSRASLIASPGNGCRQVLVCQTVSVTDCALHLSSFVTVFKL